MSPRLESGTIKQLAAVVLAIVVVLAAGAIVGQAPAIFGAEVNEEPTASIEFSDQRSDGTSVVIDEVSLSDGGFVVVTDGAGEIVAVSEYLGGSDDPHENVTINQTADDDLDLLGQLTATVHQDTTGNETFMYEESDGDEDRPYTEDGYPVSDTATVTMADRQDGETSTSFLVDSLTAPSSASTHETIEIVAEIRNPNEFTSQQHVELRLSGQVLERQVLELEADDAQNVTFEMNTSNVEPGNHTFGVYTAEDGLLETIDLEYGGPTTVEVTEANDSTVTVNASLTADGFVGVEDESGDLLGTSEGLEPGIHENVTVDLEAEAENGSLTAVVFEGDPDDPDGATPVETDGERVEAPVPENQAGGIE
ncbi:DUF7282 domain-containing protein [Natrononativus amylolyticus]|uniref:DUF7282 domain-containing protein n=1 Tax=Natrononativus amylolyticus TaxID=2963434 RepID=UPI0020CF68D9|nr:DUF4179 domain-containing protein [Natrononativus amylolyticus]